MIKTADYLRKLKVEKNVIISGDPRFIAISEANKKGNQLNIEIWKGSDNLFICGSTHTKDENILLKVIPYAVSRGWKVIIAPHEISDLHIKTLQSAYPDSVLYSDLSSQKSSSICIVDTWGVLKELYRYADISYIGGG